MVASDLSANPAVAGLLVSFGSATALVVVGSWARYRAERRRHPHPAARRGRRR